MKKGFSFNEVTKIRHLTCVALAFEAKGLVWIKRATNDLAEHMN